MADERHPHPPIVARLAGVAFTFFVMNCSAVMGLVSALRKRKVWR
jgi:hypothetical protein